MTKKLAIEYIPISEIIPYSNNPRINDKAAEKLAKLIKEYGFRIPILLDHENKIIAGHTRLKAAQILNMTEIPVIWLNDLTPEQAKAFRLADNVSHEWSDWNNDLLKNELEELKQLNFNLDLTGFSEIQLNKILPNSIEEKPLSNEIKYQVKKGQIYQLGRHKLMCGDCTTMDINKLFIDKVANMIVTDPPYGVNYSEKNEFLNAIARGNRNQTPIENDKEIDIRKLIYGFFTNSKLAEHNTIYVFTSGKNIHNVIQAFEDSNFYYSQDLKWIKNNHVLGRLDYNPKSENIIYGWKGKHEFYGGFQTDVLFFDKPTQSKEHPTMKPIELIKTLITHGSQENGIVYDGFGGSGTTLIACEQTNRICYMMEIDESYCSVIMERFYNLTGIEPVLISDK
jgi:DNA modification methylase